MFTEDQIVAAFAKVQNGADFPQFVRDLMALGVVHYDTQVADGATVYVGADGTTVAKAAVYPPLAIADQASAEALHKAISATQRGETDYPTFCQQVAAAGAASWRVDLVAFAVIYHDLAGAVMVREPFPQP